MVRLTPLPLLLLLSATATLTLSAPAPHPASTALAVIKIDHNNTLTRRQFDAPSAESDEFGNGSGDDGFSPSDDNEDVEGADEGEGEEQGGMDKGQQQAAQPSETTTSGPTQTPAAQGEKKEGKNGGSMGSVIIKPENLGHHMHSGGMGQEQEKKEKRRRSDPPSKQPPTKQSNATTPYTTPQTHHNHEGRAPHHHDEHEHHHSHRSPSPAPAPAPDHEHHEHDHHHHHRSELVTAEKNDKASLAARSSDIVEVGKSDNVEMIDTGKRMERVGKPVRIMQGTTIIDAEKRDHHHHHDGHGDHEHHHRAMGSDVLVHSDDASANVRKPFPPRSKLGRRSRSRGRAELLAHGEEVNGDVKNPV